MGGRKIEGLPKAIIVFAAIFSFTAAALLALFFFFGKGLGLPGANSSCFCLLGIIVLATPPVLALLAIFRASARIEAARKSALAAKRRERRKTLQKSGGRSFYSDLKGGNANGSLSGEESQTAGGKGRRYSD